MAEQIGADEVLEFGVIGHGSSGSVRSAVHLPTHRFLAIKRIQVMMEREKRQQFLNEVKWLMEVPEEQAEALVRFHGAYYDPSSSHISIALEFVAGGSLQSHVAKAGSVPEPVLANWAEYLLDAFEYLHTTRNVVHRDVKPANVLLALNGRPKLTDFGLAAGVASSRGVCDSFRGTMCYMSPERVMNKEYSYSSDIWSLGLTLLEAFTGKYPYNVQHTSGPFELILQICEGPAPSIPDSCNCSEELTYFVSECLEKEPDGRPTAAELLQHPFLRLYAQEDVDLASYMRSSADIDSGVSSVSEMFARYYYHLLDTPQLRRHLRTLYHPNSTLRADGDVSTGPDNIVFTLNSFFDVHPALGRVFHRLRTVDSSPLDDGGHYILVTVRASLFGVQPGEQSPEEFATLFESFLLAPGDMRGQHSILTQLRRVVFGDS